MSHLIETYYTIDKQYGPQEFKEKGSRFISYLYPVRTAEQGNSIIEGLRKKYFDSTHVCFAFRLGEGEEVYFRYNDDGEPSGTAGVPIYNEIRSKEYFNVLAAVVRYYGGTKLGTGGLARAYGHGAKLVLDISQKITVTIKQRKSVSFPFDFTGEIMQMINRFGLEIVKQDYTADGIHMQIDIPVAKVDLVSQELINRSAGKIKL